LAGNFYFVPGFKGFKLFPDFREIPGGGFVKVKKKCTKFPYCNQGDINALKITKNESVKEAIKNVAKNMGISENVIKTILEHEYEKNQKRNK
jgi:hypothetical protein